MRNISLLITLFTCVSGFSQFNFLGPSSDAPIQNRGTVLPIVSEIAYQGYEETQAYFGEGEYEIFLDTQDGILDKPIIVLDGFDPGDARDITGLYNSLGFEGDNLADLVREEGFDIVVLNAPQYTTDGKDIDGGADYIQRNALVLVQLIQLMNDQKVGDEELVILGPSMGGLIGRYALAYMEANSLEHETRLYISFDSPHKGANIPISLQYLINYLGQEFGNQQTLDLVNFVLNSPAAKEMLFDHYLGHLLDGSTTEQDPTKLLPIGAPNFRDAFQAELDALGFPANVRNVAMVNGSGMGTTIGTPGMQVIDTNLDLGDFASADVSLHFTPAANSTINVMSFQPLFAGFPVGDPYLANGESAEIAGIDSSPGGTGNISTALGDGGADNPVIVAFIEALDQDEYSFIPVVSALALENEDDWYVSPDIGGTHTSPFVNSFIPDVNEPHVMVTDASAAFALSEILQVPLGISGNELERRYALVKNPVTNTIQISLSGTISRSVDISIFALTGENVMSESFTNPEGEISIPHLLQTGIYLLSIADEFGSETLKLVVN